MCSGDPLHGPHERRAVPFGTYFGECGLLVILPFERLHGGQPGR
jgi:hypothetical protein